MKFFEYIYKGISYIFIVFIVALITLTFGMPDFISTSSGSDRYIAAKIGDEIITKPELARAQQRFIQEKFKGYNLPDEYKKQVEENVFKQLINNKLFLLMLKDISLYPVEKSKGKLMAKYLKENFSSYFSDTVYDYKKFEKEILIPNRISYSDLQQDVVSSSATQLSYELFDAIKVHSKPEEILLWEMENTRINYQIGVVDQEQKNKILRRKATIKEADIQENFKKNYLSKDPKAILTKIKREAIQNKLFNEKKGKLEKEFLSEIRASLKKSRLTSVASRNGIQVYSLRGVALSENLEEKKPKNAPSLSSLDKSKSFHQFITLSKVNEPTVILEGQNIFLVNITQKLAPKDSLSSDTFKEKKKLQEFLEKKETLLEKHSKKLEDLYHPKMIENLTELEKAKTRVRKLL